MENLHNLIWGKWGLSILLVVSIYFTLTLKLPQIRHMSVFIKGLFKKDNKASGGMSQLHILTTSLGAVMGIGNLVGVASSIVAGGPGALFWMFISSIIISILKYVEILLTGITRRSSCEGYAGGVMYYMQDCFNNKLISKAYVIVLLIVTILMGNMIVSNSIASSINVITELPMFVSGIIIALTLGLIIYKGINSVVNMNAHLVPYMIFIYFVICFYIMLKSYTALPAIFNLIISEAFKGSSISGGFIGTAMKFGVSRGIYSNEAGMGTCTLAHGKSNEEPKFQAMFGVMEVFIDSILMCMLSGVVLLLANVEGVSDPTMLLIESFKVFLPVFGEGFVLLSLILFGVSSILGWYFYGIECVNYLSNQLIFKRIYSFSFILFLFIGSIINVYNLWLYADVFNGFLLFLNVFTLLLMRKSIIKYENN